MEKVMKSVFKKKEKKFYVSALDNLNQVELAIGIIMDSSSPSTEFSILGKMNGEEFENKKVLVKKRRELRGYWHSKLNKEVDLGFFSHPEIGYVYIVGPLVPMFLYKVSGKKLASLSRGVYGILRGFGILPEVTLDFLDKLNKGSYLIILRDYESEIPQWAIKLDQLHKTG
ncbi:hypothetical protein [Sediminicola sp. 1XM1-17]|uniref:hypothetical protein n=1 Tax=Sediminicola sp. 1XM1-17 TaxID=3127702 RepID=UPI003076C3C0